MSDNPTLPAPPESKVQVKKPRGFATKDRKWVSDMGRLGGKKAQENGTAHRFDSDEARVAGKKGGAASAARFRNNKSQD